MSPYLPIRLVNIWSTIKSFLPNATKSGSGDAWAFNQIPPDGGTAASLTTPYSQSTWVRGAIREVANPISAVNLYFYQDKRGGEVEYIDQRLADFWEKPALGADNRPLSYSEFVEASVGWLKLEGEVFYLLTDEWLRPFPARGQLPRILLGRPDRMRHIIAGGELSHWDYRDAEGRNFTLLPEQVIHVKCWNPTNAWRGLGELDNARMAADTDYKAATFVNNLMGSNGDRGPIIGIDGPPPTEEQRQQINAQLRQKLALARRGKHTAAFIPGNIRVEDPQIQQPDAAFNEGRLHSRHEIYIAFGVPPSRADVVASYSIGSASDLYHLITNTCIPTSAKLADAWEMIAEKLTGRRLYAEPNWDEHPVMQQVRAERMGQAKEMWDRGIDWKTINNYLRLGLPEFPGWDVGYLPFSVAAIDAPDRNPATNPNLAEDPSDPDDQSDVTPELEKAFKARKARSSERERADDRDPREIAQWQHHQGLRRPVAKNIATKFRKALMTARRDMLAKIEAAPTPRKSEGAAADMMFDNEAFKGVLLVEMNKALEEGLQTSARQLIEELGLDDPFLLPDPEVKKFLALREKKISGIADNIFDDLKKSLSQGLDAGETKLQLADRVREKFTGIGKERAEMIAQTETSTIYGEARHKTMKTVGVTHKRWLTSGNANVRASHRYAGEKYRKKGIPIDEPFDVAGHPLMHPGDPNGPAHEVINCHCIQLAVRLDEEPDEER